MPNQNHFRDFIPIMLYLFQSKGISVSGDWVAPDRGVQLNWLQ